MITRLSPFIHLLAALTLIAMAAACAPAGSGSHARSSTAHESAPEGGADPSGGEGQRSSKPDLERAVASGFEDLGGVFHRIKYFLLSDETSDQTLVHDLLFLRPCYGSVAAPCRLGVDETLVKTRDLFTASPMYVSGDCPSKDRAHTLTDMSITPELKLCVSERLTRYPDQEMKRQVLSLLAHEIVHGLGFGESEAQTLQYFVLEQRAIARPAVGFHDRFRLAGTRLSDQSRLLTRSIGEGYTDPMRVCEYILQMSLDLSDLETLYSSADDQVLLKTPVSPVRKASESVRNEVNVLFLKQCLKKEKIGTGADLLTGLFKFDMALLHLRNEMAAYAGEESLPLLPPNRAILTQLLAMHDVNFPEERASKTLACALNGVDKGNLTVLTDVERKLKIELSDIVLEPSATFGLNASDLPTLRVSASRLNKEKGLGVLIEVEDSCQVQSPEGEAILAPVEGVPNVKAPPAACTVRKRQLVDLKLVSTDATLVRAANSGSARSVFVGPIDNTAAGKLLAEVPTAAFQVLGKRTQVRVVYQLRRNHGTGASDPFGPPIELTCTLRP